MRIAGIRGIAAALTLSLLSACAAAPRGDIYQRPLAANPSAFVAAEIGFAQLAEQKGQWAAFRETAHPDALMFVPERVVARDWLRQQHEPAEPLRWQPHAVYYSCDGNVGVTSGAWQKGGETGFFNSVWLRDDKGKLHWALRMGDRLDSPRIAPDFIATRKAACKPRREALPPPGGNPAAAMVAGMAKDATLEWDVSADSRGKPRLIVRLWNGEAMENVIDDRVEGAGLP
ncbi:hypothetical protein [Sphingopyxis sp. MWB1]|uniref:hypothetical protein n=1 Tax=Sphingopyxis sp. MWB1 TaxID=1537715 RepID=UPI00068DB0E6|nr:hypothetical protein [Sphingopyxis sp. MWB1]